MPIKYKRFTGISEDLFWIMNVNWITLQKHVETGLAPVEISSNLN